MGKGCLMHGYGISGDLLQTNTADGTNFCAEVSLQQTLTESDTLKDLRTAIRADGRDTHLGHDLEQTFLNGLDVVGFRGGIVFLDLMTFHEVVQDGKRHIRTQCGSTIA